MIAFARIIALSSAVLIMSGCAALPLSDTEADDRYHDFIQELLDKHLGKLPEPADSGPTPDQYRELVLLRGQLVVGMVARYGIARTEDFSNDRANDAVKMLGLIDRAKSAMQKVRGVVQDREAFFQVYRTDLRFAVIEMSGAAVEQTVRGIKLFVLSTSPLERIRTGRKHLQNILEDKLYSEAYRQDFSALMNVIKSNNHSVSDNHWKQVNQHLRDACERLDRAAGRTGTECVPGEFDQALLVSKGAKKPPPKK